MDNEKSSKELEKEVRAHRREAVEGVHELDESLTPGQIIDNYYFGNEKPSARNFIAKLKDDPVPGALMGAAIAWSTSAEVAREHGVTYESVSREVKEQVAEAKDRISESKESMGQKKDEIMARASSKSDEASGKVDDLKGDAQSRFDNAKDSAQSMVESTKEGARSAVESSREGAKSVQDSVKRGLNSEPLLNLALGFSLGAALGAMTPLSQREEEWLSSTAEDMKDEVSAMGDQAKQIAKEKAKDVRDTLIQS